MFLWGIKVVVRTIVVVRDKIQKQNSVTRYNSDVLCSGRAVECGVFLWGIKVVVRTIVVVRHKIQKHNSGQIRVLIRTRVTSECHHKIEY